MKSLIYQRV